jgi:hypothetical protein
MYIPLNVPLEPLFALIAGILILLIPRLLNYIVALYLILIGLHGLLPPHRLERTATATMERPAP